MRLAFRSPSPMFSGLLMCAATLGIAQTPQSPCNVQADANGSIVFTWTSVVGAQTYGMELDTAVNVDSFGDYWHREQTASNSASVPAFTLTNGLTYHWHVQWNDGPNGTGNWSSYAGICAFTTGVGSPPPVPTPTAPVDGGAGYVPTNTQFTWNASTGATSYDLQVATNTLFTTGVNNSNGVAATNKTLNNLSAGQTYYWHVRANNGSGPSAWSTTRTFYTQTVATPLSLKVFLQGPLNTTTLLMGDGLRTAGLIPSQEPYTALGFAGIWNGGATLTASLLNTTGNDAIVDWVYIELRHGTTNIPQYKYVMLVQRDGDVVMPNGTVPSLIFPMTQCKVSVRHRNHLGAMTSSNVTANGSTITIDFTQTSTSLYGTNPTATFNTTRRSFWAGETTGDGIVKYTGTSNDRDAILTVVGGTTPNNAVSGYRREDVSMDGVTKYTGSGNDRDPILVTVGSTTPNTTRTQQLP